MSRGTLFVVSAPSGAGKTTLSHMLMRRLKRRGIPAEFSISYTTRWPRKGETAGRDYYFIDNEQFQDMVNGGQFIEHARVFDNFYGTGRDATEQMLATGRNLILDIDWQGARQIRANLRRECITIFILPPSRAALRERLQARGQDQAEVVNARMDRAISEISHFSEFDYVVVNDDLEKAADDLEAICRARSMRTPVQTDSWSALLKDLLETEDGAG